MNWVEIESWGLEAIPWAPVNGVRWSPALVRAIGSAARTLNTLSAVSTL